VIAAVVDPSVLVSAFIGRPDAAPGLLVNAWREERFTMVVCPLLLDELAQVLARPKFGRWAAHDRGTAYVAAFAARSAHHPDPTIQTAIVRDPKDDYLVALARAANADVLVSIDNDLLEAPVDDVTTCRPEILLDRLAGV
jgi:putative PIN family toxin of toxin-antitoxin system